MLEEVCSAFRWLFSEVLLLAVAIGAIYLLATRVA
jgi:hypothetical protein